MLVEDMEAVVVVVVVMVEDIVEAMAEVEVTVDGAMLPLTLTPLKEITLVDLTVLMVVPLEVI